MPAQPIPMQMAPVPPPPPSQPSGVQVPLSEIAPWGLLVLGVISLVWGSLNRRFNELKEQRREDTAGINKQFDALKADQNRQFDQVNVQLANLTLAVLGLLPSSPSPPPAVVETARAAISKSGSNPSGTTGQTEANPQ